jgi:hypothetical protein
MDILRALKSEERRLAQEVSRIERRVESVRSAISALGGEFGSDRRRKRGRRKMSAAGRARIAAAQKARWAKVKAAKAKKAA